MNPNHILAVVSILILLTLFSCLIAGDVFLNKIAFSTSALNCDSFTNPEPSPAPTAATPAPTAATPAPTAATPVPTAATPVPTAATHIPSSTISLLNKLFNVPNNACINLTTTEIGFAKFRIVMFWIMFTVLTVLLGIAIVTIASSNIITTILVGVLGISLWVFMVVGGIYLTQFSFYATPKKCNNPGNISNYCYDISTTQLGFARLTSVLCFPMTIALTLCMAYVIIKSI